MPAFAKNSPACYIRKWNSPKPTIPWVSGGGIAACGAGKERKKMMHTKWRPLAVAVGPLFLVIVGCSSEIRVTDPDPDANPADASGQTMSNASKHSGVEKRASQPIRGTGYVTRYDIATGKKLALERPLRPLFTDDHVQDWPLVAELVSHLGNWVTSYLDAHVIAEAITTGMPLTGQEAAKPLTDLVDNCAHTLGMESPVVFVRNDPRTTAYAGMSAEHTILVVNSGLLNLFDGREDELKFVIGRELGHLKCNHLRMRQASYGILYAIRLIDLQVVPDEYQQILPTLAAGRFFCWCREAEISADRAGLLCCGDPEIAFAAMQRLLHGLNADSAWINPDIARFDADVLLEQYGHWENQPFVKFVLYIKQAPLESPFIPERIAALKLWASGRMYKPILTRKQPLNQKQLVTIKTIVLADIGTNHEPVDVYVLAFNEADRRLFRTKPAHDMTSVTWRGVDKTHRCQDGQPIYFEVWRDNQIQDDLLGGFVIYPTSPNMIYRAPIDWDWGQRSGIARTAKARVDVEFSERTE